MLEGYESIIWTERDRPVGDFQITTKDVAKTVQQLPKNTLVSLRDSDEVMIVETHEVIEDEDGDLLLTVKGRSFESFFENRVMVGDMLHPVLVGKPNLNKSDDNADGTIPEEPDSDASWEMRKEYTCGNAAALIVWNTIVDNNPVVTGISGVTEIGPQAWYEGDPKDIMPNIVVTVDNSSTWEKQEWTLTLGSLYTEMKKILDVGQIGVRSIRPRLDPKSRRVASFDIWGDGTFVNTPNITQLQINFFEGVDRSIAQLDRPAVVFSQAMGDIEDPEYLTSTENSKTIMVIDSDTWGAFTIGKNGNTSLNQTGLNRRVGYMAAQTPSKKRGNPKYKKRLKREALRALRAQRPISHLDYEVAANSDYVYGKDYTVGDLVTVRTSFGVQTTMKVSEYIRTEDSEGDRGFPTLTADI